MLYVFTLCTHDRKAKVNTYYRFHMSILTVGLIVECHHLTAEHPEGGGVIVARVDTSGCWVHTTHVTCM